MYKTCRYAITFAYALFLSGNAVRGGPAPIPTMSLKAVEINGTPVTGDQQHIVAQRGDQITVEIRASDWAFDLPDGVRAYQAVVQGRIGAVSGSRGTILPLGWKAPPFPDLCTTDDDCIGSLVCRLNLCVLPTHDPRLGSDIDTSRSDFILTGFDVTKDVVTATLDYNYFGFASELVGQPDPRFEMYCGTLILVVSDYACGTFTYGFGANETFLVRPDEFAKIVFTALESLIIDVDQGIAGLGPDECEPCGIDGCVGCPDDPAKIKPGICGCGVPDEGDIDGDTVLDCVDRCPDEDDTIDVDRNGIRDCQQYQSVPTVSEWGIVSLILLLLAGLTIKFRDPVARTLAR